MSKPKVDLSLLKRLIAELEGSVATMESIQTDVSTNHNEFVVEASKAAGLAAGLMQESAVVLMQLHDTIDGTQHAAGAQDILSKILGPFKPGSSN